MGDLRIHRVRLGGEPGCVDGICHVHANVSALRSDRTYQMAFSKYPSAEAKEWWQNFKQLLDDNNEWPGEYVFKFIAPKENVGDLKEVFIGHDIDIKASSKGKYHSITSRIVVSSSEEVIDIYQRAGAVEGVISL